MREIFIALLSSSLTIVITSFFNYHFLIKKEIRMQANQYKTEILQMLYMPLMKEVNNANHPLDGYRGLSLEEFQAVDEIIKENYHLVSPDLALIHKIIIEEYFFISMGSPYLIIDEERFLLNHLEYNFNFYRKELGLPYNKEEMKKAMKESRIKDGKIKAKRQQKLNNAESSF
ncbi:hypothetical protein B0H99_103298 [Planomicrobium soli]|uniref:Uncharacterized protein n=1 Tax=Planomicrobium soli TaxID=1176648 RepID=A0A2P8H4L6_9BACL|nr:hypothetical protein [Planomicrobium soli]PSL41162.1 hypothetical protein B0H99_103298 [Planomicrobium soli]